MIDGIYKLEVDTPIGRVSGKAKLETQGNTVKIYLNAPIIGRQRAKGSVDGDTFLAEGKLMLLLFGRVDYTLAGEVHGDTLKASLRTSKGNFEVEGVRA